jgi:hypothetical protein
MTDDELRALVRDAVARHLGGGPATPGPALARAVEPAQPWRAHASHAQYLAVVNAGDACVIEPSVSCDHCGYCKSHGH